MNCLVQALQYIDIHLSKKQNTTVNSSSSADQVLQYTDTQSSGEQNNSDSSSSGVDQHDSNIDKNWVFVDQYQNENGALDWKTIFEIGKQRNSFYSYGTWKSPKAAYYRAKTKERLWFITYYYILKYEILHVGDLLTYIF